MYGVELDKTHMGLKRVVDSLLLVLFRRPSAGRSSAE